MTESNELLRGQISRLEGSLQSTRDRNSQFSTGTKGNYANLTLVLAGASQQMDYDRFNIRWNDSDKPVSAEQQLLDSQAVQMTPPENKLDLGVYDDEIDQGTSPYMDRFSGKMPVLNERQSERDLRDFNDLIAPEEDTTNFLQKEYKTGYLRDLSSDRSEDYDYDTPQQQEIGSRPLNQNYTRELSEEYETYHSEDLKPVRSRLRSKTHAENQKEQSRTTRSRSELEPITARQLDESLYFDNPMRIYPQDQPRKDEYGIIHDDIANELSPIIDDIDTVYEITNAESPIEEDYDVNKAISTLEESDVRYTSNTNRNSRLDNINVQSVESNRSDSDSEYDNFINQHQEVLIQQPKEEIRARSPYLYRPPISKSSLGSYTNVDRSVSPRNIIRRNEGQQESHKRLTMPAQAMANYDEYVSRTPGPYPKSKISLNSPQPNLTFRPVHSAKDLSPYETVFSNRRKSSIPDYIPDPVGYEQEEYTPVEEKVVYRRPAEQSLNRNRSTDHRHYIAYSRQDMVSPTSPLQEAAYDTQASYETSINSTEIMNTRQPTEYRTRNHYAPPIQYNNPRRQHQPSRNAYAHGNVTNSMGVGRNHGYIPNNDPSPVQSLDSGIDVSHRPGTAAANTSYYHDEFRDYDESPKDSLKDMEDIVCQLRKELKVLTTKVNHFESRGVPPPLPVPHPPAQHRVMSPTNNKYTSYQSNQLRSTSVASSGSEGGRISHDSRSPQVRSPTSPIDSYHSNTIPKFPRPRDEDRREYASSARDSTYLRKTIHTQNSTPIPVTSRPNTVSKITSNNTMQDRLTHRPTTIAAMPNPTTTNRTYTPNLPRAQSSGTFYSSAQSSRLQTPRFKAAPQINRSISPQPKTSARKTTAPITRPIYSSQSHRTSDGYNYEEHQTRIPKPNQRHY